MRRLLSRDRRVAAVEMRQKPCADAAGAPDIDPCAMAEDAIDAVLVGSESFDSGLCEGPGSLRWKRHCSGLFQRATTVARQNRPFLYDRSRTGEPLPRRPWSRFLKRRGTGCTVPLSFWAHHQQHGFVLPSNPSQNIAHLRCFWDSGSSLQPIVIT